jgi:hypothetical protein
MEQLHVPGAGGVPDVDRVDQDAGGEILAHQLRPQALEAATPQPRGVEDLTRHLTPSSDRDLPSLEAECLGEQLV